MGKRKAGLSGVSRFVLESFKQESTPQPYDQDPVNQDSSLPISPESSDRSTKRRNQNVGNGPIQKYDVTGLVPHYTDASQVPDQLQKYFSQRTRFFSLYSTPPGCLLDEEGWYSVTPELIADQIAERCRCDTILDAFCGVGGNAIAFAKTCQRVIALDTSPIRLALARHNAQIYGVADRIEFILSDYVSFAHSCLSLPFASSSAAERRIDVVFLSPPWGGPSYLSGSKDSTVSSPTGMAGEKATTSTVTQMLEESHPCYSLASIEPIHGAKLFALTRRITQNVAYYLPRNTRLEEITQLLDLESLPEESGTWTALEKPARRGDREDSGKMHEQEMVEVEEEWMGTKLKALTCYFGGLVDGQGDLF